MDIAKILKWMSDSQLFSTLLMMIGGGYALYKWQTSQTFQYDALKLIADDISHYTDIAVKYWQSVGEDEDKEHRTYALRLKTELEFLSQLIDEMSVINPKMKPDLHSDLGRLFDSATGGAFETQDEKREAEAHILDVMFTSSIVKRRIIMSGCRQ